MVRGVSELKALLESAGVRPSKRLGQNFLMDPNLMRLIADSAELGSKDLVLEVGSATGRLTQILAERAGVVRGVEIDRRLAEIARSRLAGASNAQIFDCDILEGKHRLNARIVKEVERLLREGNGMRLKVVSNLPYCISSPLMCCLLLSELPVELMVLTLQREVAERVTAKPGTKSYGTVSVLAQVLSEVKLVRAISAGAFWPRPKVGSAIVKFLVKPGAKQKVGNVERLVEVLSAVFGLRRKSLRNALRRLVGAKKVSEAAALLAKAGIDPEGRGESLSPEEIVTMAKVLGEEFAGRKGRPEAS